MPRAFLCLASLLLGCLWLLTLLVQPSAGAMLARSNPFGIDRLGPRSHIAAVGDLNSDKHTDVFVLNSANASKKQWVLEVWMWNIDSDSFELNTIPGGSITSSRLINNVVPGDFNYDGKLDVLISGPTVDSWQRPIHWMHIYIGTLYGFEALPIEVPPSRDQVLVADLNNDLHLDLFGSRWVHEAPPIVEDAPANHGRGKRVRELEALADEQDQEAFERTYWLSRVSQDGLRTLSFHVMAQPLDQSYFQYPRSVHSLSIPVPTELRSPHSHATVDLDGDCMADLVVTSVMDIDGEARTVLEIWINRPMYGPVLFSLSLLPRGAGQVSYTDADADGNIDVIVPVLNAGANQLHYYFSQSRQLCGSSFDGIEQSEAEAPGATQGCRSARQLCDSDPDFYFDFMSFTPTSSGALPSLVSANTVVHHFPTSLAGGQPFSPWDSSKRSFNVLSASPFTLRFGDVNLDGFPDLLLSVTPADGARYGVAEMWLNVPCPAGPSPDVGRPQPHETWVQCAPAARARGRRCFSSAGMDEANNLLASVSGAQTGAAFFDVEENGELDVIFTAIQPAGAPSPDPSSVPPLPGTYSSHLFLNAFHEDAFFLTALASNGVCPAWCPTSTPGSTKFPTPKPYGVNMPGATFRMAMTDLSGATHTSVGAQLPMSQYLAMHSPGVTFGLGRTNTFIDEFAFGIGINTSTVVGVRAAEATPTSDPSAAAALHSRSWVSLIPNAQVVVFPYPPLDPSGWTLELFVAPSSQLLFVFISWAALLTLLAIIIAGLHLREQREDEKEKRKHQLLFSF